MEQNDNAFGGVNQDSEAKKGGDRVLDDSMTCVANTRTVYVCSLDNETADDPVNFRTKNWSRHFFDYRWHQ